MSGCQQAAIQKKIESARSRITNAFIGLIIVVGSWSLLAVTEKILGI